MNFSPNTVLLAGLTLTLVAMVALGLYWLTVKGRSTRPQPPAPSSRTLSLNAHRPVSNVDNFELFAPYSNHVAHTAPAAPDDMSPPLGRHDESAEASHASDTCDYRWEAIGSLAGTTSDLEPKPTATSPGPALRCPRCMSSRIDARNRARKAGSTIGSVAGATGGMAAAIAGAETGAVVGSIAGPIGTVFGGLAGAVIAGLVGSAAGCAAGSAVGGAIDDNVLDNYQCLSCTHSFSIKQDA